MFTHTRMMVQVDPDEPPVIYNFIHLILMRTNISLIKSGIFSIILKKSRHYIRLSAKSSIEICAKMFA